MIVFGNDKINNYREDLNLKSTKFNSNTNTNLKIGVSSISKSLSTHLS